MKIPSDITVGDVVSWFEEPTVDNLGNKIEPTSHSLYYAIRGPTTIDLTGVVEDGRWKFTITKSKADTLMPATYYWQCFALNSSNEKFTLGKGSINVHHNLAVEAPNFDGRSRARKDLDAVQAAMRAMVAGGAVAEYTIGNRSVRKMTIPDLMKLEAQLKDQLAREEKAQMIANGLGNPHNLLVRFK